MYQEIIKETYNILDKNRNEWESRYANYLMKFKNANVKARVSPPLYKYTSISNEYSSTVTVDLRYQGQHIATLKDKKGKKFLEIDSNTAKSNAKHLVNCIPILTVPTNGIPWNSNDARDIRNFFRNNYGKTGHCEHTLESAVLTELSKTNSLNKSLLNIQPIRFGDKRYQFPTPLKASTLYKCVSPAKPNMLPSLLNYSGISGGGIDIFARRKGRLNIIELKDQFTLNESPEKSIGQAISYAVFIGMLLRSTIANGDEWYKLFGINKPMPKRLKLNAVVAMPDIPLNIQTHTQAIFATTQNLLIPNSNDQIVLHYLNLDKNGIIKNTSYGY